MVSMSPVNYAGLALYFVTLGVSMVASYRESSPAKRVVSLGLIAITWFFILRFSLLYPTTEWYQQGLNLFDVAYADVIWGGSEGSWSWTQMLLCWAVVATVWTLESPLHYQLFGLFGAMSGSYCLIRLESEPSQHVPASLLVATLLAFVCVWMLPNTLTMRELSWWLWGLHACLIWPKMLSFGCKIDRGVLYMVLAFLSFATHVTSSRILSPWPTSDCQISISVDVLASSGLTLAFIGSQSPFWVLPVWTVLLYLASPGFVLGAFCGLQHMRPLRSSLVVTLQHQGAQLLRSWFPAEADATPADASWMNLGYWQSAQSYDEACCNLAELVARKAGLKEGKGSKGSTEGKPKILCVGCGPGAELHLFQSLGACAEGLDVHGAPGVRVGRAESMASGVNRIRCREYSKILAVDSMYHFDKARFLKECAKLMPSSLTYTDIVLRNGAPVWVRLMLCAMDIEWKNHWTEPEYRLYLSDWEATIQSLEPQVLARNPLLPRFLTKHLDYVLVHAKPKTLARPTCAVIGSGMSGLISAHLLEETHEVVIFEAGPRCGLVGLQQDLAGVAVDVPLRFMMPHYYTQLLKVINTLGVPTKAVPYNASYQNGANMLLVTSTDWAGHILQHIRYVPYLAMLMFTVFFRQELPNETFLEYMQRHHLHEHEAYRIYSLHLSWMLSCTYEQANNTPAGVVLGFIRASNPFVRMYQSSGNILRLYPSMRALQERLLQGKNLKVNSPVSPFHGSRCIDGVTYDVVIVATDAPAAGYLLGGEWQEMLSQIHHHTGRIVVHKDPDLMPCKREHWRTFNIREDGPNGTCQITVWLNKFWDRNDLEEDLFETWNPAQMPRSDLMIKDVELARATYTRSMHKLWPWIQGRQGKDGFYVAGAYAVEGMSLLEQACVSAIMAANAVQHASHHIGDEHPSCSGFVDKKHQ